MLRNLLALSYFAGSAALVAGEHGNELGGNRVLLQAPPKPVHPLVLAGLLLSDSDGSGALIRLPDRLSV